MAIISKILSVVGGGGSKGGGGGKISNAIAKASGGGGARRDRASTSTIDSGLGQAAPPRVASSRAKKKTTKLDVGKASTGSQFKGARR